MKANQDCNFEWKEHLEKNKMNKRERDMIKVNKAGI
jgi:hypothetical protein